MAVEAAEVAEAAEATEVAASPSRGGAAGDADGGAADEGLGPEGCRQRQPQQHADAPDDGCGRGAGGGEAAAAEQRRRQASVSSVSTTDTYGLFVFPHALDSGCLDEGASCCAGGGGRSEARSKLEETDEDDEEDEDTDAPVQAEYLGKSLLESKMFTDPEEREKWKNRGWRAAQCCGGALLVLALIFDELD